MTGEQKEETIDDLATTLVSLDNDGKEVSDDKSTEPEDTAEESKASDGSDVESDTDVDEDNEGDDSSEDGMGLDELLGSDDAEDDSSDDDAEDDDGDTSEDDDGAEESTEDEEDTKKSKPKSSVQKRINDITKARRIAEARAERAEEQARQLNERIEALEKKLTPEDESGKTDGNAGDSDEDNSPNPDDFTYGEIDPEYIKAIANHAAEKAADKIRRDGEAARQLEADQRRAEEISEKFVARKEAGAKKYDDFEEKVVHGADTNAYPLSENVALMALDSDVGHDVLYAIASNPKLAREIDSMDEKGQARAFGRLEAKYISSAKAKPNKTTKAPPVPARKARGTSGRTKMDPATASFEALEAKWLKDGRI